MAEEECSGRVFDTPSTTSSQDTVDASVQIAKPFATCEGLDERAVDDAKTVAGASSSSSSRWTSFIFDALPEDQERPLPSVKKHTEVTNHFVHLVSYQNYDMSEVVLRNFFEAFAQDCGGSEDTFTPTSAPSFVEGGDASSSPSDNEWEDSEEFLRKLLQHSSVDEQKAEVLQPVSKQDHCSTNHGMDQLPTRGILNGKVKTDKTIAMDTDTSPEEGGNVGAIRASHDGRHSGSRGVSE